MRVRTVVDLGTTALYLRTHDMLLVDADLTEAERAVMVRMARARFGEGERPRRHLHPV